MLKGLRKLMKVKKVEKVEEVKEVKEVKQVKFTRKFCWDSRSDIETENGYIRVRELYLCGSAVLMDRCHAELGTRVQGLNITNVSRYHHDCDCKNSILHSENCEFTFVGITYDQEKMVEAAILEIADELCEGKEDEEDEAACEAEAVGKASAVEIPS